MSLIYAAVAAAIDVAAGMAQYTAERIAADDIWSLINIAIGARLRRLSASLGYRRGSNYCVLTITGIVGGVPSATLTTLAASPLDESVVRMLRPDQDSGTPYISAAPVEYYVKSKDASGGYAHGYRRPVP